MLCVHIQLVLNSMYVQVPQYKYDITDIAEVKPRTRVNYDIIQEKVI